MSASKIERGDIFYISQNGPVFGSEQMAGRPAIIVSNDKNNAHSETVEVIYLTTQEKAPLPTHVSISSAPDRALHCANRLLLFLSSESETMQAM